MMWCGPGMRRAARVDDNQGQIVDALRRVGCSVWSLAGVGNRLPGSRCGFRGRNLFLEVKDGSKPPCKRKLTPDEEAFHASWRGHVAVVESVQDALKIVGVM